MSLEIRRFRAAEMEQGWELDRQVFASPPAFKERFLQMADPDRVYGAFDSGRAVALLGVATLGGRMILKRLKAEA